MQVNSDEFVLADVPTSLGVYVLTSHCVGVVYL